MKRPDITHQVEEMRYYRAGGYWVVQNVTFGDIEFRSKSKQSCKDYIKNASCLRLLKCKQKL